MPKDPSPEGKVNPEFLYPVSLEVVNDLRRITRSNVKKLGGLSNIPELPRRQSRRKELPFMEDSVLVRYFEELVDLTLQEIVQPLDQLGPTSPPCSPFRTLVQSSP